ncbi:MAG: T9SS type A sorting domain-containing protein [Flavobacteriales bacterium]
MLRSYTLIGAALLAGALCAQHPLSTIRQAPKGIAPPAAKPIPQTNSGAARASSNCVLFEDFESVTIAELVNAGWSIGPQVERLDRQGVPLGRFVDAWRIADAESGSSTYMQVPDEPPGDHFIVANDDGPPCDCDMDNVGLETPSMDFTGLTDMSVSFRVYADQNFGGDTAHVQASTDGGISWENIRSIPGIEGAWQHIVVRLNAYDGLPDVKLRFQWTDLGEWATGVAVDDICVSPILANNLAVQAVYMADVVYAGNGVPHHIPYTYVPMEQLQPLDITVAVINNGGQPQTHVMAKAKVYKDGDLVGTYSTAVASLAAGARDSLVINTTWTPAQPGEVRVDVTLSAEEPEELPADNSGSARMHVTDQVEEALYNMWGIDANAAGSFSNGGDDGLGAFKVGNISEVLNPGSVAYGVAVAFGGDTDPRSVVTVQLLDAGTTNFPPLAVSDEFQYRPWMGNDAGEHNFTFIPFTEPIALVRNSAVIGALVNAGGVEVRWANSGMALKRTAFINRNNGTEWFYITGSPMVRLYLADAPVGVPEVRSNGLILGANIPNPFNDNTTIQYELPNARPVNITVTNVDGKVVLSRDLGQQAQGRHAYDVDATKLAAGVYSYTLTAGEDRLSRRMMIVK